MKRVGYLYDRVYSMDNLILAHQNARKKKTHYREVIMVDGNPERYLTMLQQSLIDKTYKTSEYRIEKKMDQGKEREIYKLPYYPDRICQWAILQVIEPYLLRNFIRNTFSAIPGRGTSDAHRRVEAAIRNDRKNTRYCLQIDIKKYYASIDHDILKSVYRTLLKDRNLLWLIDEIIDSIPEDKGIPIGNYLSQYSGNLFLSELDHWILEETDIAYYFRYMDDDLLFHESKEYLHDMKLQIDEYLQKKRKLTLKDNWQVFPTGIRGVDFVGYRMFPKYTLLRKSIAKSYKLVSKNISKRLRYHSHMTKHQFCSLNSYKGWLEECDAYRLKSEYYDIHIDSMKAFHKDIILGGNKNATVS